MILLAFNAEIAINSISVAIVVLVPVPSATREREQREWEGKCTGPPRGTAETHSNRSNQLRNTLVHESVQLFNCHNYFVFTSGKVKQRKEQGSEAQGEFPANVIRRV